MDIYVGVLDHLVLIVSFCWKLNFCDFRKHVVLISLFVVPGLMLSRLFLLGKSNIKITSKMFYCSKYCWSWLCLSILQFMFFCDIILIQVNFANHFWLTFWKKLITFLNLDLTPKVTKETHFTTVVQFRRLWFRSTYITFSELLKAFVSHQLYKNSVHKRIQNPFKHLTGSAFA